MLRVLLDQSMQDLNFYKLNKMHWEFICVVFLLFKGKVLADTANVLMSEVFEIIVDPALFNWTYEGMNPFL